MTPETPKPPEFWEHWEKAARSAAEAQYHMLMAAGAVGMADYVSNLNTTKDQAMTMFTSILSAASRTPVPSAIPTAPAHAAAIR